MFRSANSKPDPNNFGAGSVMKLGNDSYMVIAEGNNVSLLDMATFQRVGHWMEVQDVYFMTEVEARKLGNKIEGVTFSDYELMPRGFKELKFFMATPGHESGVKLC